MEIIDCPDEKGNIHKVNISNLIDRKGVYGIDVKDGKTLLIYDQRSGYWEFPGGGAEEGESDLEGLRREFMEEVGLEISSEIKLIEQFEEFYLAGIREAWRSDRRFYLVQVIGGEMLEEGNGWDTWGAKYLSLQEIEEISIKPKMKEIARKILQ